MAAMRWAGRGVPRLPQLPAHLGRLGRRGLYVAAKRGGLLWSDLQRTCRSAASGRSHSSGAAGQLLPTYTTGIRGGLMAALDDCNSIGVSYLHYENDVYDQISTDIYQIRSLVSQPSTWLDNATSDWSAAAAQQHIILDVAEINYKWMMFNDNCTTLSVLAAGRYGSLEQRFGVAFTGNGEEDVNTNLHFEGGGLRLGLECTEAGRLGFSFYGRGSVSCLAGSFRSSYVQSTAFAGNVVDTGFRDERIVPILDCRGGRIVDQPRPARAALLRPAAQQLVQRHQDHRPDPGRAAERFQQPPQQHDVV